MLLCVSGHVGANLVLKWIGGWGIRTSGVVEAEQKLITQNDMVWKDWMPIID